MKKLFEYLRKHKLKIGIISVILLVFIVLYIIFSYIIYIPKYPYTQEYIPGTGNIKGNVNLDNYKEKELAIGANKYGFAVFKNPKEAFKYIKKNNRKGIKLIQKEFNLAPFNQFNYEMYGIYGCQVTSGTKEERDEAFSVSGFLDIYENSFKGS